MLVAQDWDLPPIQVLPPGTKRDLLFDFRSAPDFALMILFEENPIIKMYN
jgi:hypothetical protein